MEYKNISEIAEVITYNAEIDYEAVWDFLISNQIHPDTLVSSPTTPDSDFFTTLMVEAICSENAKMAKLLLELGSDPNFECDDLFFAPYDVLLFPESEDWDYIHTPKLEILKMFLAYGFDVDKPMGEPPKESFYDYLQYSVYENGNDYHRIILSIVEPYHKV